MAKYEILVKGCISIGGKKFVGGSQYDEKELGNIKVLKGFIKQVEELKSNMSLSELKEFSEGLDADQLKVLLEEEKEGSCRKGVIKFLEDKIKDGSDV